MNLFLYGESKQEKQKQGKASKNQGSWTKGHPKNTQRDSVATSWAANVNTKGTNICSGPILTSLWAALGAKGLPKAPQKRHRGPPTPPIMSLKHTLWNTKTRTVSHSDFNDFFTSKVDPRTCKPGLH